MTKEPEEQMNKLAEANRDRSNQSDPHWNYVVKKDRELGFKDGFTAAHNLMQEREKILVEALEFMTMPLTRTEHTIESLLETIETDIARGKEALARIQNQEDK